MNDLRSIDEDVKKFILEVIDSFEHIEILLLLHANQDRQWTARDVFQKLRNSEESALSRLNDLATKGILSSEQNSESKFRFQPQTEDLRQTVNKLAKTYIERRVSVIDLIFSKRTGKIQVFADAFKFRKD